MRQEPGIDAAIESCEAYARRVWWSAFVMVALIILVAWRLRGPSSHDGPELVSALGTLALVGAIPHAVFRVAVGSGRLRRLRAQPVEVSQFGDESRLLMRSPLSISVVFRRPIDRRMAAAVPQGERSTLLVARSVARWNVVRIHLMVLGVTCVVAFFNPGSLGTGLLVAPIVALVVSCRPAVRRWVPLTAR